MKTIKMFEEFDIVPDKEYLDLLDLLDKYDVPREIYGTEGYKTIGHLYNEIKEGETVLTEEDGVLVRRVYFVGARVVYKLGKNNWLRLHESKQIFKDGRVRKRKAMPYSMAEKFKTGEDPKEVIIRGMDEELKIKIDKSSFVLYNKVEVGDANVDGREVTIDYPGITSYHTGYEFFIILKENQYQSEGYIEHQSDKDVYFNWKPAKPKQVRESFLFESLNMFEYLNIETEFPHEKIKYIVSEYIKKWSETFNFFMHDNQKLILDKINPQANMTMNRNYYIISAHFNNEKGNQVILDFFLDDKFKVKLTKTSEVN